MNETIKIKILLTPKIDIDLVNSDAMGEGRFFYNHYLKDCDVFEIGSGIGVKKAYVKDGIMLMALGQGKVSATFYLSTLLRDNRFDFSDAYILNIGCCGCATGYGTMGDVFVITAAVDGDLGHRVDKSELQNKKLSGWFHDQSFDMVSNIRLNEELANKVFNLVKDTKLKTTAHTKEVLLSSYGDAAWANREPIVQKGTTVTSDNYWKGKIGHEIAKEIVQFYNCPDPYATSEMEDLAVAWTCKNTGNFDRLITIRAASNTDTFLKNATPENLWIKDNQNTEHMEKLPETADIFPVAMENLFNVCKVIIDAIIVGDF